MSSGAVANYEGGTDQGLEIMEGPNGELFYRVYNDLAAAASEGDCYFLDFLTDADSKSQWPTLVAMATTTVYRQIVSVQNGRSAGKDDIADQTCGFVQYRGLVVGAAGASVVDEQFTQGTNASQALADDGTSITTDSQGVAKAATASSKQNTVFFGQRSLIG